MTTACILAEEAYDAQAITVPKADFDRLTTAEPGCTSGRGVCGLAWLSRRSMIAVPVFMATAAATVFVIRHVIGG